MPELALSSLPNAYRNCYIAAYRFREVHGSPRYGDMGRMKSSSDPHPRVEHACYQAATP